MALVASGQQCELREIVLRDKPDEMVAVSPKAIFPVLVGRMRIGLQNSQALSCNGGYLKY